VRAVVLVYADDVANKLRAQRDAAYSLFAAPTVIAGVKL
jgi:hypothetical protein